MPFLDTKIKYARIQPSPSCQEIKEQKEKEKEARKKEREAKAEANYQKAGKAKPKKSWKEEKVKPKETTSTSENQETPTKDNVKTSKPSLVTRQKYRYATHIISGKYRSKKYPLRYPVKRGDPRVPKLTDKEPEKLRIYNRIEPVRLSRQDYIMADV